MSGGWSAKGGWSSDADYDYDIGDVGLVLAAIDKVTNLDAQAWFDAWAAAAVDLEALADEATAAGHLGTARWAYLAASEYCTKALVFADAMADRSVLLPDFKKGRAAWEADAAALLGYAISQGGYWITKARAFEHWMVAAIADPGAVDVSVTWPSKLSPHQLQLLDTGQKGRRYRS
jgi:hypothetical protein